MEVGSQVFEESRSFGVGDRFEVGSQVFEASRSFEVGHGLFHTELVTYCSALSDP